MKRSSRMLPLAMLALAGCAGQPDPATTTTRAPNTPATAPADDDLETAVTFVSLKVPNME